MKKRRIFLTIPFVILILSAVAFVNVTPIFADTAWDAPGNYNPIVPGYYADATIEKFGDTFYLYPTTDGVKNAAGDPTIWISKDFVNWYNLKTTIPTGTVNWWAPDVVVGPDGKYYYYHAAPTCEVYGHSSTSPTGPWTPLKSPANSPVIPNNAVANVITLDGQGFKDDDGTYYMYFCTWATNSNSGCGWVRMNSDMKSYTTTGKIPNTQALNVFEGPFMFKRDSKYYLTYSNGSCFDGSYNVQYSTSTSATGAFTYGKKILSTNADDTINGPGHHAILQEGSNYYIIYHAHDYPHSCGGEFRQQFADVMTFDASGGINVVTPTHQGVGYLGPDQNPYPNLCYTKTATASSYYTDTARGNFAFQPRYAVDDNNATLWKAGDSFMGHWLLVDLGSVQSIARTMTQFEYTTYYYQYLIEYSSDGVVWSVYADKRSNKVPGCPMVDTNNVSARYLRITITGVEKPGMYVAIWNFKAFASTSAFDPPSNPASANNPAPGRGNLLIKVDASGLATGTITSWANQGTLGGSFSNDGTTVQVQDVSGKRAVTFTGSNRMKADFTAPQSLSWNSPFTTAAWVYNPAVGEKECIAVWAQRGGPSATYAAMMYGTNGAFSAVAHWDAFDMPYGSVPGAGAWRHIAITFDGQVEKVYVDGNLNAQEQKYLNVWPNGTIYLGYSGDSTEYLSASIASFRMYDVALSAQGITDLKNGLEPGLPSPPPPPGTPVPTQTPTPTPTAGPTVTPGGDMVTWYKFDETSGTTAADSSGNGNNATLVNGPTWVADKSGNAVNLDGSNDYVSMPTGIVSNLNDFTTATWVKLDTISTWSRIFDFGTGTSANMFLTPQCGSGIRFAITTGGSGGEQQINGSSALVTGAWKHVAVTLSGNTGILYVDGVEVARNSGMTLKPSSLGSTTQNYIGKSQYADPYLDGLVDDFQIYNRALSASEVQTLAGGSGSTATPTPTPTPTPTSPNLFYDGFESNNFTAGGWTNSGCTLGSTYKYAGTYAAIFNSSDSLTKARSTAGYQSIQVKYARYTRNCETDDHFIAEWYNGSVWATLEDLTGNSAWTVKTWNLPADANNNTGFQIRFRTSHNGSSDYAYLDEVQILGTPQ